jgi:hypothetical protein
MGWVIVLLCLTCWWPGDPPSQTMGDTSITCKWLLAMACTPLAAVIFALWRALEKSNAGHLQDLKNNFKSIKEGDKDG